MPTHLFVAWSVCLSSATFAQVANSRGTLTECILKQVKILHEIIFA